MKEIHWILVFSLLFRIPLFAQTCGWVDMSSHIPTAVGNANLTDVSASGESVWISSSNLKGVFCSTDGGNTFTFRDMGVGIQGLYRFSDGIRGWCVGGAYGFKTEDGGESWTPVFIGSTLLSITFASDMVGYATGTGSVYRTDDGGTTWNKKSDIFNLYNRDVMDAAFPDPANPLVGYVCVANEISTLFKTNNGGDTWEYVTLTGVTSSLNDLDFSSPTLGWAVGGEGNIFRYENLNWSISNPLMSINLNSVASSPDSDVAWSVGNSGTILHYTPASGWIQDAAGLTDEYLAGVDAVNGNTVYAVGMNKTFLKYAVVDMVQEDYCADVLVLPTPATYRITIRMNAQLNRNANLIISLLDLSGRQIRTTEERNTNGEINLDISSLPSGITLVKIISENVSVTSKLLKR